jgi:branched-chain amino acid transport system substrate-binding protein
VISTSFLKDANDPIWKDDPAVKEWLSFMTEHYASGDRDDGGMVYGYAAAQTMVEV